MEVKQVINTDGLVYSEYVSKLIDAALLAATHGQGSIFTGGTDIQITAIKEKYGEVVQNLQAARETLGSLMTGVKQ